VADAYNLSYLEGRYKEDPSLNPTWANSSRNLFSKHPSIKEVVEWFKVEALSSSSGTTHTHTHTKIFD
jgi:hypothetical protein